MRCLPRHEQINCSCGWPSSMTTLQGQGAWTDGARSEPHSMATVREEWQEPCVDARTDGARQGMEVAGVEGRRTEGARHERE
jgi:hypothetical protein